MEAPSGVYKKEDIYILKQNIFLLYCNHIIMILKCFKMFIILYNLQMETKLTIKFLYRENYKNISTISELKTLQFLLLSKYQKTGNFLLFFG